MPKKILVIDDEELIVKTLAKYLKNCGYEVEAVNNGEEAVKKAAVIHFNLIIADIRMPGINGIETLKRIRESNLERNKEEMPAIIITGYAGGEDVYKNAEELGIVECIYKPFELDEFVGIVRRNLELPLKPYQKAEALSPVDKNFISLLKEIQQFLQGFKDRFDEFDRLNSDEKKQIAFIGTNKKEIFGKLDNYFKKAWDIVKDFSKDKYLVHQNYYQQTLGYLLLDLIETNRHVYRRPLGYPGDYIMMNYIYDYHTGNYLGSSSYEKIINHYTCNIPISCSNIKRKDFLKEKIIETLNRKDAAKILSIASGPARELLELLKEGKINKPLLFKCLDSEKKALDYINNEINKIENTKTGALSIEYICRDIVAIIRDKNLKNKLQGFDLVYAFGIYDYLSDRMASRLTEELFQLLQKEGKLIIFNANLKNNIYRAYYELLGEWHMVHRNEENMLSWTTSLGDAAEIKFEELSKDSNYLCLSIVK